MYSYFIKTFIFINSIRRCSTTSSIFLVTFSLWRIFIVVMWGLLQPSSLLISCIFTNSHPTICTEFSAVKKAAFNLTSHRSETVFDADIVLGWCFKIRDLIVSRKLLSLFFADLSFLNKITFISNKHFTNIISGKSFNFIYPLSDIIKSFSICHVIHYNYPMSTSVITSSQSSESLLASSIPNLQLDILTLHLNRFYFKIYSNSVEKVFIERIFLEAIEIR